MKIKQLALNIVNFSKKKLAGRIFYCTFEAQKWLLDPQ